MKKRDCAQVIDQMLEKVPQSETDFIKDLEWNRTDASYKAPEETLQWQRTMDTLQRHIPSPVEEWEFEAISIFTTRSVDELKKIATE